MKKYRIFLFMAFCFTIIFIANFNISAANKPLDLIQDYTIKINPRNDATLDITYNLTWEVLDSTSEGPLEWVKIGAPNTNFEIIGDYSDNIKEAKLYKEGNDVFVRVDFKRAYEAGEVVRFYYTIHQSNMYVRDIEKNTCTFSFTPGWFDDIEVKHVAILWNSRNIRDTNAIKKTSDGYLLWEDSLQETDRLNASIVYNLDVFTTSEEGQVQKDSNLSIGFVIICIIGVIIVISIIIAVLCADDYGSGSGFGGGHSTFIHTGGCVRSSCVSCACACACAGGGRAGCSKKDCYSFSFEKMKKNSIRKK